MPAPLLFLAGAAAALIGAAGHSCAKDTNEEAERIRKKAKELYDNSKISLEKAQHMTEKSILDLSYTKKKILDTSIKQFLDAFDKVKHIQLNTDSIGLNEIENFQFKQQDMIELREMTDIYDSTFSSGATGVAVGAVALAATGSLGTLGTAGATIAAGGIAATGAALAPFAAIAGPAMLFTAFSASMKADENLEKANVSYAEAEKLVAEMKVAETLCRAITKRSEMFDDLLVELDSMFSECTALLEGLVRKKEGRLFKKKLKEENFSENEIKLMYVTRSLAGAIKAVLDTPILTSDGHLTTESKEVYDNTQLKLTYFTQEIESTKVLNNKIKPIPVQMYTEKKKMENSFWNLLENIGSLLWYLLKLSLKVTIFACIGIAVLRIGISATESISTSVKSNPIISSPLNSGLTNCYKGLINDSYEVVVDCTNLRKSDEGNLLATSFYTRYPDTSYDIEIIDNGTNSYTLKEILQGQHTGTYSITLLDNGNIAGQFVNVESGNVYDVDLKKIIQEQTTAGSKNLFQKHKTAGNQLNKEGTSQNISKSIKSVSYPADWNIEDDNWMSNRNITLARPLLLNVDSQTLKSQVISASDTEVLSDISSYYGQVIQLTGKAYNVAWYPYSEATKLPGQTGYYEINFVTDSGITVVAIVTDDTPVYSESGDTIQFYGIPVGTHKKRDGSGYAIVAIGKE